MRRILSLATVLMACCTATSFGQLAVNDQWVQPIRFEVTEAIGTGVQPNPLPAEAHFAGHSTLGHDHGSKLGAAQKDGGKGKAAYPYTYTTRLGMLFMDRDNHNRGWLTDTAAGADIYASNMGPAIGFKTNVIRHNVGAYDRELGFIGLFSDSGLNFNVIDDDFNVNTTPAIGIAGDGVALNNYKSSLLGVEYNLRNRYDNGMTALAGFRWISLDEDFLYNITVPGAGPQIIGGLTETTNNLFGLQVGLEGVILSRGCMQLEGGMKAGGYWNMAEHTTSMAGVPAPGLEIIDVDEDKFAFEGEVEFAGVCQLTDVWNLRIGYQFLWLEGVALAPDQISAINLITNSGIDTSGSPFYHGALVQLEGQW